MKNKSSNVILWIALCSMTGLLISVSALLYQRLMVAEASLHNVALTMQAEATAQVKLSATPLTSEPTATEIPSGQWCTMRRYQMVTFENGSPLVFVYLAQGMQVRVLQMVNGDQAQVLVLVPMGEAELMGLVPAVAIVDCK